MLPPTAPTISYPRASSAESPRRMYRSRGAANVLAKSSTIASRVASPVHRFNISTAIASVLNTRSGASRTHPPCASLCDRRTPLWQPRADTVRKFNRRPVH